MSKQAKVIKPLQLKKAIFKFDETIIFAAVVYFLAFPVKVYPDWLILLLWAGLLFLIYRQWVRLKDRSPKVIIDEKGIEFTKEQKFYPWDAILYAHIIEEGSSKTTNTYLEVTSEDDKTRFDMEGIQFDEELVADTIKHYSKGNAGDKDMLIDDIFYVLSEGSENSGEMRKGIENLYIKSLVSFFLLFIPVLGTGIYSELELGYKYSIGFAYCIAIGLYAWYNLSERKKLRQSKLYEELQEESFDVMLMEFNLLYPEPYNTWAYWFMGLVGPAIFVIAYFVYQ